MGILSSSVSLTRYKIISEVKDSVIRQATDRLTEYSFRDIDNTIEERSFGWVGFEDMLDSALASAPPQKAHYLAFALRLDTRRIAPAVFKKHFRLALDRMREQVKDPGAGRRFFSRDDLRELREQVKQQLLGKTLPVPAVFDVVWNLDTHVVYLASTRAKTRDMFEELFARTFEAHLAPLTPYFAALDILGEKARPDLDALEPGEFAVV